MKTIILLFLLLTSACLLNACSSSKANNPPLPIQELTAVTTQKTKSPEAELRESLHQQLEMYKDACLKGDAFQLAGMSLPGLQDSTEMVSELQATLEGMQYQAVEFGTPSALVKFSRGQGCTVPMTIEATLSPQLMKAIKKSFLGNSKAKMDMKMVMKATVICYTEDDGVTWKFLEGDEASKLQLLKARADIIQKLSIPRVAMNIQVSTPDGMKMEVEGCEKNGDFVPIDQCK